ncbi:MAG: hypothetical protein P1P64_02675 [Treponemataceae bacterium]
MLHNKSAYVSAIKKLFPKGAYWDKQFSSAKSDLSLWLEVKAEELYKFRSRFNELIMESTPKTAEKTLDKWEQVLLGSISPNLPSETRRRLLTVKRHGFINKSVLENIAELYGCKLKNIYFPYRSSFFGHTRIAINRICSPASFSLIFIQAELKDTELRLEFEDAIKTALLANNIVFFMNN